MRFHTITRALAPAALVSALLFSSHSPAALAADKEKSVELLNVSYDPTRELYEEVNPLFAKYLKEKTGQHVTVRQSHGGSGTQARAVIEGLPADVVTLALAYDIDVIAEKTKKFPQDWQERLPHNSSPYTSTVVFLVRKDNPKHIKDWDDLVKEGVQVITPNPKTSGGARWNYLAAWAYADKKFGGDEKQIKEFIAKLFHNVPVLDTGARGSLTAFAQRGVGDVLIAWENEAFLALNQEGKDKFEIVVPSISVLAEPPVAVVDENAKKHGAEEAAKAYLEFLYTPEIQRIVAKRYYRPTDPEIVKEFADQFPKTDLVTIAAFGGWKNAQKIHFDDGGVFDQIYKR
ncbi:MAG: sulfate ABC transporter substrate-binding protein [Rickettsiales bacterium]